MRKLALPALVACALLAASAPVATAKPVTAHAAASLGSKLSKVSGALKGLAKAVSQMKDVNTGQTAAINGVDTRVTTVVANLTSLSNKVDAVVTVATASLTKLQDALTSPGIGGQLGAAGSKLPGKQDATNTATPDTLPAGTVYRQIVVATATYPGNGIPAGTPVGARTWVKLAPPATAAPLDNAYTCTSAGSARQLGLPDGTISCTAANITQTNP
jgi:hypothetical protein